MNGVIKHDAQWPFAMLSLHAASISEAINFLVQFPAVHHPRITFTA
jgi:hypothetical protein